MVQGGMVLETSLSTIVHRINEQEKLESAERTSSSSIAAAMSSGGGAVFTNLNNVAQNLSNMTDKLPNFSKFTLK